MAWMGWINMMMLSVRLSRIQRARMISTPTTQPTVTKEQTCGANQHRRNNAVQHRCGSLHGNMTDRLWL